MGTCRQCQEHSRSEIFVSHVVSVAKYVSETHKKTPIIWDDMLRNLTPEEMDPLKGLVEPMVWVYAEDVYRFVPSFNWDRYGEIFDVAWTASAFKGAHGPTLTVPPVKRHLVSGSVYTFLVSLIKNLSKNPGEQPQLAGPDGGRGEQVQGGIQGHSNHRLAKVQ